MAYYRDYSVNAPYNTSIVITKSAASNETAYLLANAGFEIIGLANTSIASSATNYAEVSWNSLRIRIYNSSTTNYALDFYFWYSGGTSYAFSLTRSLPYVAGQYITVAMRFYNTKKGFRVDILNASSGWDYLAFGLALNQIKDGAVYYGLGSSDNANSNILINDGLSSNYFIPAGGIIDADGIKQILSACGISSTSGSNNKRFLAQDVYTASGFILTGLVTVQGRCFHIRGVLAYEINP